MAYSEVNRVLIDGITFCEIVIAITHVKFEVRTWKV